MVELKQGFLQCWRLLPGHQRALLQLIDWSDWKGSWTWMASETRRTPAAVRMATIRYIRGLVNCLKARGFEPSPSELLEVLEQGISEFENTKEAHNEIE